MVKNNDFETFLNLNYQYNCINILIRSHRENEPNSKLVVSCRSRNQGLRHKRKDKN